MLHVFFDVFIAPLMNIMEIGLNGAYALTGSYGLSILLLSVLINILVYPFYALAEGWQQEEKDILSGLQSRKQDIKEVFKGDEQYFYLKTLYRQHHYSPLLALRSSFGLLIQIPFFIAAYQFLSHFKPLNGVSFLFLSDLAHPDRVLGSLNIMPIIMTVLNLGSAYLFASKQTRMGRYQLYGMAALFLALLYNSPSGLLLYWSCNNLISLIKNLYARFKPASYFAETRKVLSRFLGIIKLPLWGIALLVASVLGSVALYYVSKSSTSVLLVKAAYFIALYLALLCSLYFISQYKGSFISYLILLALLTFWGQAVNNIVEGPFSIDLQSLMINVLGIWGISLLIPVLLRLNSYWEDQNKLGEDQLKKVFSKALLILVLLAGVVIPTSLIASSPEELSLSKDLILQVITWAVLCLGFIPIFLYYAAPGNLKKPIIFLFVSITALALVNFIFFPGNYGVISGSLQFEFGFVKDPKINILFNLAVLSVVFLILLGVFLKTNLIRLNQVLSIMVVSLLILSGVNGVKIRKAVKPVGSEGEPQLSLSGRIPYSRTETNTVILFLDRALAGAVPLALEAYPELNQDYDGFTWYPDTLSFGVNTITALPAMLGGYEYTPQGMKNRNETALKDKAIEGLMVLPEIFLEMDHSVFISNPLHKGFAVSKGDLPTLDKEGVVLDDLDGLSKIWLKDKGIPSDFGQFIKRDKSLYYFSIFRIAPLYFRSSLYDKGFWHSRNQVDPEYLKYENLHNALSFFKYWAALDYLPQLGRVDSDKPTFTLIGNKASHEVMGVDSSFQPTATAIEYPREDLERYGSEASASHIYTNIAVLKIITDWISWLKDEGLYDNTQIIIVSDHGRAGESLYDPYFPEHQDGLPEYTGFHPLFMMKPFNSRGSLEISDRIMTNADVPSLVLEAFGGRANPFTGKPLDRSTKQESLLVGDGSNLIYKHSRTEYLYQNQYYVTGSMLNRDNWRAAE